METAFCSNVHHFHCCDTFSKCNYWLQHKTDHLHVSGDYLRLGQLRPVQIQPSGKRLHASGLKSAGLHYYETGTNLDHHKF